MSWSYGGDPALDDTAAVRFLIGDTDYTDKQLQDEEIAYLVTAQGSVINAAIAACDNLIAKYARLVDVRFGPSSEANSQRVRAYESLKKQLKLQSLSTGGALPYAGGVTVTDKETTEQDDTLVRPKFTRTQFDYPGDLDGALSTTDERL